MVSGMVRRLVEIEAGSNATESQFFLEMERRTCLRISEANPVLRDYKSSPQPTSRAGSKPRQPAAV